MGKTNYTKLGQPRKGNPTCIFREGHLFFRLRLKCSLSDICVFCTGPKKG